MIVAAVGTPIFTDMRKVFLVLALLFVTVGFARGNSSPENAWLKAFLLIGFCLLGLLFASGTPLVIVGLEAVISYAAAVTGLFARRSWGVNRTRGMVIASTILGVIAVGSVFGAPVLARRLNNRSADANSGIQRDSPRRNGDQFLSIQTPRGGTRLLGYLVSAMPPGIPGGRDALSAL